ncbi:hypothetical protein PUN28_015034 [Cardiocondyla obscurior]|uniref:Uncharacterized protein n=1 Tax=Cardiocondyla obscurior TaxID=286306 RepID=A0AAW2F2K5_9HYME
MRSNVISRCSSKKNSLAFETQKRKPTISHTSTRLLSPERRSPFLPSRSAPVSPFFSRGTGPASLCCRARLACTLNENFEQSFFLQPAYNVRTRSRLLVLGSVVTQRWSSGSATNSREPRAVLRTH